MKKRLSVVTIASLLLMFGLAACSGSTPTSQPTRYQPPPEAHTTVLAATAKPTQAFVIEAATDISFMGPFLREFQKQHPNITIYYHDMLSTPLFARAESACRNGIPQPDLYLTVATDHLVKLANDGCGQQVPASVATSVPGWREWRHEVFAFAVEPAVFVYNRELLKDSDAPRDHLALINALRLKPDFWNNRIGTYDIEQSGIAFNYAEWDSRRSASFGRLIEGLGRSHVRLYCCSNEMARAVERGDILLAYNVQLSYAYAAQRANPNVGVIVPTDYQAVQTRSVMIPNRAEHVEIAREFIDFLLSPVGQRLDEIMLAPPNSRLNVRFTPSDRILNQADVSVSLLRLQDRARHDALTSEWNQAVRASPLMPSRAALN